MQKDSADFWNRKITLKMKHLPFLLASLFGNLYKKDLRFMFNLEFKSWIDSNAGVRVGCSFIFSWFGVTLGHLFTSAPWCKTFLTLIFAMHYIYKKNQILNDLQKNASHQMHEIFHSKIRFISGTRKPPWFFPLLVDKWSNVAKEA